ncbi:MAG: crosslink repair DNA glycosylase YcaQ family protein [Anaerolineae bacterium]
MTVPVRSLSIETARRLAVVKQRLAGPRPSPDTAGLLDVARSIRCYQLDPISAVARSHTLVAFSRLGPYDPALFDQVLFQDKTMFEYWAHAASIVLTEDYPIHSALMRRYVRGETPWENRVRAWVHTNQDLHDAIVADIRENGPRLSRQLEADGIHPEGWVSSGWTSGRNVSRMLDFLWTRGEIMVAGRPGGQKAWDLTERFLPEWADRSEIDRREVSYQAIQHAVRALGVGRPLHIKKHFIRDSYFHFDDVVSQLEAEGKLLRAHVHGPHAGLRGTWLYHADDDRLIDQLETGEWQPRTVLLSPFDNLICDRSRTEAMWDYFFRTEIYVPQAKRQYGYYVLSILDGDRLIGRIDPTYRKKERQLDIHHIYQEPGAPTDAASAKRVAAAIRELAQFLGARNIQVENLDSLPAAWKKTLSAL